MKKGNGSYQYRTVLRLRDRPITVVKMVEISVPPERIISYTERHNVNAYEKNFNAPFIQGIPKFVGKVI